MTRRQPPMLTEQTATSQRVSLVGEPSQHHDACDPAATPPRTQRCGRRRALSCSCCAVLVVALGACAFVFWPRLLVVCVHYLRITAGLSVSTIPPSAAVHLVVPVSFDSSNLWTLRLSAIEIDAYRAGAHDPMSRGVATEVAVSAGGVSSTSFVLTPVPSLGAGGAAAGRLPLLYGPVWARPGQRHVAPRPPVHAQGVRPAGGLLGARPRDAVPARHCCATATRDSVRPTLPRRDGRHARRLLPAASLRGGRPRLLKRLPGGQCQLSNRCGSSGLVTIGFVWYLFAV